MHRSENFSLGKWVRWIFQFAGGDQGIFLVISLCKFKKFEFFKRDGWEGGIRTLPPLDPGILMDVIPYLQKEPFV